MAGVVEAFSLTNPVFRAFVFWSTVLVLKMLAMSALTGFTRFKKKVELYLFLQCIDEYFGFFYRVSLTQRTPPASKV